MSSIKERLDDILQRPMNRQQFLKQLGLLLLAVVGVTNILNSLEGHRPRVASGAAAGPVYGASVYAGGKKPV